MKTTLKCPKCGRGISFDFGDDIQVLGFAVAFPETCECGASTKAYVREAASDWDGKKHISSIGFIACGVEQRETWHDRPPLF